MMQAARFSRASESRPATNLEQQRHQSIGQHVARGLNPAELAQALDRLVLIGMPAAQAKAFIAQAESLYALIQTENNRLHHY
jgi:hypothetical protein